ncbi:MAG: metal-dependent hydrolase [Cyanobacteria bacterium J06600_6]
MSSFAGHSLAAITVYVATGCVILPQGDRPQPLKVNPKQLIWLGCLIVIASIPDLDYVAQSWNSSNNQGLRVTHSLVFSLIAPCLAIAVLRLLKSQRIWLRSCQATFAGLSHLVLDLLVGVTPLPLLFPLIKIPFKLPFGILPSAGKIDLYNYYFYRNLGLEMGVLMPLFLITCLFGYDKVLTAKNPLPFRFFGLMLAIALLICAGHFMQQNLQLPR